ncbi:MAG: hypothetical protein A3G87_04905 [Omnitrophica bacterium RIFCSPLOWO2_12_FULL_50_11]|nr:MAG: hypothetical protein A3G87_04905 [Omnitrophica bacterium RIFCSPLOWO2_12_FULL_50_11]
MLDFLTRLIQPIIPIRREEWRKTILMFLYFFLSVASLNILKSVRDSLFITEQGAKMLRYAYVGEGLFLILFTFTYVNLSGWIARKNILFSVATAFFVVNIFAFWFVFMLGYAKWFVYLFWVWVAAYSITIMTQGWTLANDIFNPHEAKRLFGCIISGASAGGVVGGLATKTMAEGLGTESMLIVAGVLLSFCIPFINIVWKCERMDWPEERQSKRQTSFKSASLRRGATTWKFFFGSRYLLLIAGLVAIAKIASALLDNQWKSVVEVSVLEKNARTAYFGGFFALLNVVSFLMQLVISSRVLRQFGVAFALLLLPVGLCIGSAATVFFPLLGISSAAKIYDGSLNYSVNQIGKEILYLPIPRGIRYNVKPLIDMLVYRASKGIGGFVIIAASFLLGIPDQKLGLVVLILLPFWVLVVWGARDEYMQAIKKLLVSRKTGDRRVIPGEEQITDILVNLEGEHSFEKLKAFLDHRSSVTRKMSATACLAFYSGTRDVDRVKRLVKEMMRYEALELKDVDLDRLFEKSAAKQNGMLDEYLLKLMKAKQDPKANLEDTLRQEEKNLLERLSDSLSDPREAVSNKRKAILILTSLVSQDAVEILLNSLATAQDHSIRFNVIRALNRIRAKGDGREFNSGIIKKEVLSEIENNEALLRVVSAYHKRKSVRRPEEDYLLAALEALREESLERIFRLLALLYSSDVIHVIYDRLVELEPDQHIRANALELLENVVEPELSLKLRPIFEESVSTETDEGLAETTRKFLASHDMWLQICAVFLIAELALSDLYATLHERAYSDSPMIREAVGIALAKIGHKK